MTTQTGADGVEAPAHVELPTVEGLDRYQEGAWRRGRGRLLAVAAAVILLVTGLLVFSPDNTAPALAAVHDAAGVTADFDSGRVTATFAFDSSDGAAEESISGDMQASFSGLDVAATLNLAELGGEASVLPTNGEARFIDGALFISDGSTWYTVEQTGFLGQAVADYVDPRGVLRTIGDLVETAEVGDTTIDGIDTTHYQSVVDLGDESLGQSGWLPVDAADIAAEGDITVDLYIDEAGVLRQFALSGDLQETDGGAGTATFLVTTTFFDLGADITIDTPADAITVDPLAGLDPELLDD